MSKRSINGDGPELSSQEARELEEIIFSARNFVVPSPDLRRARWSKLGTHIEFMCGRIGLR